MRKKRLECECCETQSVQLRDYSDLCDVWDILCDVCASRLGYSSRYEKRFGEPAYTAK